MQSAIEKQRNCRNFENPESRTLKNGHIFNGFWICSSIYFNLVEDGALFKKLHGKFGEIGCLHQFVGGDVTAEARLLAIQTLQLGLHR